MKPTTPVNLIGSGIIACILLLIASQPVISAVVVNVDLNGLGSTNTYTGQGAYATTGSYWNAVSFPNPTAGSPIVATDLLTSDNVATTIDVTFNTPYQSYQFSSASYASSSINALLADISYNSGWASGTPATFSITGLTPGGSYDLYLYGSATSTTVTPTQYTIGTSTLSLTGSVVSPTPSFSEGTNYVVFEKVIADGSGNISGSWKQASGTSASGHFSGLQIISVPEPSTVVLLAFALGSAFVSRARHNRICQA